jgi:hypothetical protein
MTGVDPRTAHNALGAAVAFYADALGALVSENDQLRATLAALGKQLKEQARDPKAGQQVQGAERVEDGERQAQEPRRVRQPEGGGGEAAEGRGVQAHEAVTPSDFARRVHQALVSVTVPPGSVVGLDGPIVKVDLDTGEKFSVFVAVRSS